MQEHLKWMHAQSQGKQAMFNIEFCDLLVNKKNKKEGGVKNHFTPSSKLVPQLSKLVIYTLIITMSMCYFHHGLLHFRH